jgi:hypothetical protein
MRLTISLIILTVLRTACSSQKMMDISNINSLSFSDDGTAISFCNNSNLVIMKKSGDDFPMTEKIPLQ